MFDFNKMVEKHIEREHKPKTVGKYYPSEIGSCIRKLWYSYKYPLKVEPDLLKIFEVGNILHGFVTEVLKSEKNKEVKLLKSEFPFKMHEKDFEVSGRVDDLLLIKSDSKQLLVEVKSTKNVEHIKSPQSHHRTQLMFYMYALQIHDGIILYVDKSNLQSKSFEVKFDNDEAEKILEKFSELHKDLKDEILPIDEAKKNVDMMWMCNYCEYKSKCDKNEK